jgi:hypothetical protein
MKKILCVIDFSKSSGKVLQVAGSISKACDAHLIIIYPYRLITSSHSGDMTSLRLHLENDAKEKFKELGKNISEIANISHEFQPEIGFIADRIDAHVKKGAVDMVVISQELTANTNDIKGFNLQHLITCSKLPFMIVPFELNAVASV